MWREAGRLLLIFIGAQNWRFGVGVVSVRSQSG